MNYIKFDFLDEEYDNIVDDDLELSYAYFKKIYDSLAEKFK